MEGYFLVKRGYYVMQTKWYNVDIHFDNGKLYRTMRILARNKGDAIGQARKQYLDHTLSFKAFNVNKEQSHGN